jgi:hypothetical protein
MVHHYPKEDTIMTKETEKTTKTAATKTTATKATKKTETKPATVKNTEKKNTTISIEEVEKLYTAAGIRIANPGVKGNYRIMGSKKGSSLNLQKTKYIIFSTDDDYAAVEAVKGKYQDLVLEKGGNSQDKSRPNRVEFTAVETLKALLAVYAKNPLNKVVAAK